MVAERFVDTWTKLRVFELHDTPFSTICFLDADMLIFKDPSPIVFSAEAQQYLQLEQGRGVLATHVCVCNLDKDPWAPASWTKENCAYTALDESSPPPAVQENPETHSIFNSGAVVFRPSKPLSDFIFASFHDTDLGTLRKMKFPDQDFLNSAFRGRWRSLPWSVNGLKTWRYWHTNIWSDEGVRVLHYIVDKPWARTIGEDGKAGYRGDDGETHRWWWAEYERWREERQNQGEHQLLQTTKELVADGADEKAEMSAIGSRVQAWAQSKT
jgi:alpha-N-acetylglucosamine transferase